MKIYTKRGDSGLTDLFGGDRVKKLHIQVRAYGAIDHANSALGLVCAASDVAVDTKKYILNLMKLLFCAGAEIATAQKSSAQKLLEKNLENKITQDHVSKLENKIDKLEQELEPLKSFILPTGCEGAARLHFARSCVRQAEIALVELQEHQPVREEISIFFNRLSDLLFVLARYVNYQAQITEQNWSGRL